MIILQQVAQQRQHDAADDEDDGAAKAGGNLREGHEFHAVGGRKHRHVAGAAHVGHAQARRDAALHRIESDHFSYQRRAQERADDGHQAQHKVGQGERVNDGVEVDKVSALQIKDLFRLIGLGRMAKEAASDVLVWLAENPDKQADEAVEALKLGMLSEDEVEALVDRLIRENQRFLNQRKENAFGLLMGLVMKQERGRVEADEVKKIVTKKLADLI